MTKAICLAALLLFCAIFCDLKCFAQEADTTYNYLLPRDSVTKKIMITGVVKVDSLDALQLFSKAKVFLVTYKSIQKRSSFFADESTKTIVTQAGGDLSLYKASSLGKITDYTCQLKLEFKENRYRYTVTDIRYNVLDDSSLKQYSFDLSDGKSKLVTDKGWHQLKFFIGANIHFILYDTEKYLSTKTTDF